MLLCKCLLERSWDLDFDVISGSSGGAITYDMSETLSETSLSSVGVTGITGDISCNHNDVARKHGLCN